jgi:4-amino-4-deoxy-L-arabinose transferase-like glycosyltransferase
MESPGATASLTLSHSRRDGRGDARLEAAAFISIVVVAAFLRLYRLGELPPGIDLDEARNGVEVLRVLAGSHPLFFTTFDPREPAFIYSLSLAVRALGHTALAMRITGAAWGLLGVALTYPVARQWFGRGVALLATAGMAGSLWALAMSRWAERDVTLLPPLLLFLFFFWRGFERRSTASFALAGIFAALCAYAYVAARILPLLIVVLIIGQWLLARESVTACRKGLLVGLAAALLTIAPLAAYFAGHPQTFFGRIAQINSIGQPLPGLAAESVWQTAANTLGMFFLKGDVNWRDNVASLPVFPWWAAVPFCFGLLWALRHLLSDAKTVRGSLAEASRGLSPAWDLRPCLWLVAWQAMFLIPAFLARPSPQYDRTIGAAPSTYILLALGLAAAAAWLKSHGLGRTGWILAGGLVGLLAVVTYRAYFQAYPAADQPRHVFQYGQVADAAVLNQRQPPPERTFIFLGYQSATAVRYLAPQYDAATWMEDFSQLLPIPPAGPATYVFAQPSLPTNGDLPSILQRYFPDATLAGKASFLNGDQAGRVFDVSDQQLRAFQGAQRRLDAGFGGKVRLDSVSAGDTQLAARPGDAVRLGLTWTVAADSSDNYAAFVHVVGPAGDVIAQDDRQGVPTGGWRAGQRFLSLHEFGLPPDTPAGVYRVLVGVDRRTVDVQPSQSLGELGAQVEALRLEVAANGR